MAHQEFYSISLGGKEHVLFPGGQRKAQQMGGLGRCGPREQMPWQLERKGVQACLFLRADTYLSSWSAVCPACRHAQNAVNPQ